MWKGVCWQNLQSSSAGRLWPAKEGSLLHSSAGVLARGALQGSRPYRVAIPRLKFLPSFFTPAAYRQNNRLMTGALEPFLAPPIVRCASALAPRSRARWPHEPQRRTSTRKRRVWARLFSLNRIRGTRQLPAAPPTTPPTAPPQPTAPPTPGLSAQRAAGAPSQADRPARGRARTRPARRGPRQRLGAPLPRRRCRRRTRSAAASCQSLAGRGARVSSGDNPRAGMHRGDGARRWLSHAVCSERPALGLRPKIAERAGRAETWLRGRHALRAERRKLLHLVGHALQRGQPHRQRRRPGLLQRDAAQSRDWVAGF